MNTKGQMEMLIFFLFTITALIIMVLVFVLGIVPTGF